MLCLLQEVANAMYSLAIMTFDVDYSVALKPTAAAVGAGADLGVDDDYYQRVKSLLSIHIMICNQFKQLDPLS